MPARRGAATRTLAACLLALFWAPRPGVLAPPPLDEAPAGVAASPPSPPADPRAGERGFPLIRTYAPSLRDASTQNFDVARDPRGVVYAANAAGVLVYDGAWWRLVAAGRPEIAFAVESDEAGRVAVGGADELGYLAPDSTGTPRYVSLLPLVPAAQRKFGQVLDIAAVPGGFAFMTETALLLWDGKAVAAVATYAGDPPYARAWTIDGTTYVWEHASGLLRLAGGRRVPVPGGEAFRGRRIDLLLPAGGGGLLVSVRGDGLYLLAGGRVAPFAPEASRWTAASRLMHGLRLADGRWAIASVLGGLLLLGADGSVDQVIDSSVGLPDDYVSGVAEDREGALWVSLNNGLARIEVASPLSVADRRSGLTGSVYALARHQGELWVGTAAGVFTTLRAPAQGTAPARAAPLQLRQVPGFPPGIWSLLSVDQSGNDDLLVGTAFGVHVVRGGAVAQVVAGTEEWTTFALTPAAGDPDRVWAGFVDGLGGLRRGGGGRWRLEGLVPGVAGPVRTIVTGRDGILWCGTSHEGVLRVEVPAGWPRAGPPPRVLQAAPGEDLFVHRAAGRILVTRRQEVLRLDEATAKLVPDPELAALSGRGPVALVVEDAEGNLWTDTNPPTIAVRRGPGRPRSPRWLTALPARGVQPILAEPDGVVWLGTENGVYRHAGGFRNAPAPPLPPPLLARITAGGDRLLFGGAPLAAPAAAELPPDVRRLRIEFAPLSARAGLAYQSRVDPLDDGWSEPSGEPFTELTRLPPGSYTFRVRTRGPNDEAGPESRWSFSVLPPWYGSPWALFLWAGLAVAGVRGYGRLRSRALRQRAARLEARVAEQTLLLRGKVEELRRAQEDLERANARLEELSLQDELTGIPNRRRLQQALAEEWARARRHRRPIAFVLLDLDHFKLLNDTRGHREGDAALQAVAAYLAAGLRRSGDLAARFGGEEFAVLLPGTGRDGALEVAAKLRAGIEALVLPHEAAPSGRLTASFGVAAADPPLDDSPERLIEAADRALYRAKTEGRNRVCA